MYCSPSNSLLFSSSNIVKLYVNSMLDVAQNVQLYSFLFEMIVMRDEWISFRVGLRSVCHTQSCAISLRIGLCLHAYINVKRLFICLLLATRCILCTLCFTLYRSLSVMLYIVLYE